jgi:hypothetical protein
MYSSDFRDLAAACGITISATYVYKMTPQTLATFAATGAAAGTFVGTGSLDTTLYGPVQCELLITVDIEQQHDRHPDDEEGRRHDREQGRQPHHGR